MKTDPERQTDLTDRPGSLAGMLRKWRLFAFLLRFSRVLPVFPVSARERKRALACIGEH